MALETIVVAALAVWTSQSAPAPAPPPSSAPAQPPAAEPSAPKFIELFDGKSLDGWERHGGAANFVVEDGCIVGRPIANERNSFLCTKRTFSDFVLEYDFKIDDGFNSGVQIRSRVDGTGSKERVVGYQIEIDPSERAWSAGLYEEGLRGWLASLENKPDARAAFRHNEWNHVRVEAIGARIRTWINGVPAIDHTDSAASSGIIGLQVHSVGGEAKPVSVRWRDLRLEPRSAESPVRAR
ncbi:MAG: DUF1080 domain-containing protein [Phycisphaerales bacterium]